MNKNLNKTAKELFNKIRSRISNIQMGDGDAKVTDVPEDARYFSFGYKVNGTQLGSVTLSIDDDDGLVVMYSNDLLHGQPDSVHRKWFGFLRELRQFAKKRFLNFEARDILKTLDKGDYDFLSKNRGGNQMSESKLWGTSKTSYQKVGESKIVVRHTKPVNGDIPQGRTRNISGIYIENVSGERFKYPYNHLGGARAMGRHVANGGNPYDDIGSYICGLSEELSKLKMFKGYVDRNSVISESMTDVKDRVFERIEQVKKQLTQLQSQSHYSNFAEQFVKSDVKDIPEDVINDWVDRLTVRTFNEELKNVFPFIYRLMDSAITVLEPSDLIVSETQELEESNSISMFETDLVEYEKYLDSLVEDGDIFSAEDDSLLNRLIELMAEPIPVGADGANAIESISGIINDDQLSDVFRELADISPDSDARHIIYDYIRLHDEERGTDILSKIKNPDTEQTQEPAPQEPPQESTIADSINRAINAGAKLDDKISENATIKDAILKAGYKVEDFFKNESSDDDHQITEFVKSMYDRHTGTFPKGETGVLLSVEKQFGKPATKFAVETIKQLRSVFETNRMKKLAGM